MRVVQIVTQMEAAGAQKVAYLLHQGFKTRVRRSELWFLYTKRPAYSESDGIRSLFPRPPKTVEYAVIAARLYCELRAAAPDVVITHTHYANVLGQTAAAAAGISTRLAVHHNPLPTYPKSARILDRLLGRLGAYSGAVAVSDTVAATLCSYSEKCLATTIHNGLELAPREANLNVRAQLCVPEGAPLLLSVGRLSAQKNHELTLRALREIPGAHLAIVGGGELKDRLTARAAELHVSDRVHLAGEIPAGAVVAYLSACDVFVFPSLWEGLPMAAIEALHAGAAIVASDIPASREALDDAAVITPVNDHAALATAIRRVLENPALAGDLRRRARERAIRFSTRAMVDGYHALISRAPLPASPAAYPSAQ